MAAEGAKALVELATEIGNLACVGREVLFTPADVNGAEKSGERGRPGTTGRSSC